MLVARNSSPHDGDVKSFCLPLPLVVLQTTVDCNVLILNILILDNNPT